MFKHLFKLIWNKKKQNALLITEMLVSFMVMFAVFSMLVNYYNNYKTPMGFRYENVWVINTTSRPPQFKTADSAVTYFRNLRNIIKAMPQVIEVSYASSNTPFTHSMSTTGYSYKGKKFNNVNFYRVDDYYNKAFDMQLLEGRWFNSQDDASPKQPVVINQSLRKEMFGNGKAIGQLLGSWDEKVKDNIRIIGVVADMKDHSDFSPTATGIYNRADTSLYKWISRIVIKVSPTADAGFEGRLYKTVAGIMKQTSIEIEHFTKKRDDLNREMLTPIVIMMILATFLIINVALGLFGVLWYNINKRRGEIGLRRAIGATGNAVSGQIVVESMVLATLSLIVGTFFAVQFPLLNLFDLPAGVYITAIFLSIIFIYVLVLICSLYPGRQAAAVQPAIALHEE
jgi:putative ABC transport system permease protein